MTGTSTATLLELERCVVVGILNVTPDSFSDGGRFIDRDAAVAHGLQLRSAGADYVDVGGESTRPGAIRISADEELRRVVPVIAALAAHGIRVSVDTTRARVAEAAIAAGASMVNDVSGGLADARMAEIIAAAGTPWVLVHWRGPSQHMYAGASYRNVVAEVKAELLVRIDNALALGIGPDRLVIDPGLGFAKHPQHDLALLRNLGVIVELGFPVLVGASRKRFLGEVLAERDGRPRPADQREAATIATSMVAARAGVWGVRVHDVAASSDAVRIAAAIDADYFDG